MTFHAKQQCCFSSKAIPSRDPPRPGGFEGCVPAPKVDTGPSKRETTRAGPPPMVAELASRSMRGKRDRLC
jgi:hypothetical protein